MRVYHTKVKKLGGTDFREVHKKAFGLYRKIASRSKRRPYIRSFYFKKDKVFLTLFWQHLWDKHKWQDRMRRLRYFAAAIDLIQHSPFEPKSKENPNRSDELLHRFCGTTKEKDLPLGVVYQPRAESLFHYYFSKIAVWIQAFFTDA